MTLRAVCFSDEKLVFSLVCFLYLCCCEFACCTVFIPPHGDYKELRSYKKALIVYDATVIYKDFIRTNRGDIWDKNSKEALYVRKLAYQPNESFETYREFIETRNGIVCANIILCQINQCNYLLDRQIRRLEQDFIEQGGLRERMTKARKDKCGY